MQKVDLKFSPKLPWVTPANREPYSTYSYTKLGFYSVWASRGLIGQTIDFMADLLKQSLRHQLFPEEHKP